MRASSEAAGNDGKSSINTNVVDTTTLCVLIGLFVMTACQNSLSDASLLQAKAALRFLLLVFPWFLFLIPADKPLANSCGPLPVSGRARFAPAQTWPAVRSILNSNTLHGTTDDNARGRQNVEDQGKTPAPRERIGPAGSPEVGYPRPRRLRRRADPEAKTHHRVQRPHRAVERGHGTGGRPAYLSFRPNERKR